MRKLQEIDYEKIEKGFKDIDKAFNELEIENFKEKINFEDFFSSYYNGYNGMNRKKICFCYF